MSANTTETVTNGLGVPATRMVSFGAALRAAREKEGIRQGDFAGLVAVDQSTLSSVELGSSRPSIELHAKLCELLPALKDAPKPRKMKHSPGPANRATRAAKKAAKAGTPAKPPAVTPQYRYESVIAELKLATAMLKNAQGRVERLRELAATEHAKMLAAL